MLTVIGIIVVVAYVTWLVLPKLVTKVATTTISVKRKQKKEDKK